MLSKKIFRYHRHPNGRRTLERREFRGYGEGGIALVGPTWSDEPQVLFVDLQFLTMDFEAAWAKLVVNESVVPEPEALETPLPEPHAPKPPRKNIYETEKTAHAYRLFNETFPGGIPSAITKAELIRQIMRSDSYKALEKTGAAPKKDTLLRRAGRRTN